MKNIKKTNDKQLSFYTGLQNVSVFMDICSETSHHVNRKKNKLSDEDELLLTLMKLRKNLCMQDLAYRFGISKSSATRIFHAWLDVLYIHLGRLVMWPDTIEMHLPKCFRNKIFRRVRCIIDCTEIFIERASNNKARSQTYSRYKQHNTVKFLIGISPSGAIIFLSPVWGGRASDKTITLTSGIIDKFVPGDVVLADRGFFIDTELATRGAQLMARYTAGTVSRSPSQQELYKGTLYPLEVCRENLPCKSYTTPDNHGPQEPDTVRFVSNMRKRAREEITPMPTLYQEAVAQQDPEVVPRRSWGQTLGEKSIIPGSVTGS
ncbi:uncharacterized protein LOC125374847 [Haliotis rufescens]|uniref:uncharacterized protein LOC125374847 n=1 Tax=Haliotis rufescens TaxID=6454 RepID=UPI00201F66C9|nr:uncharacterized protein LOC125374847 [Haliotis rufescens]